MTIHPEKYTYKNFIDTIDFSEIQKTIESMNIQLQRLTKRPYHWVSATKQTMMHKMSIYTIYFAMMNISTFQLQAHHHKNMTTYY